jgi:hypothetical protein
MPRTDVQTLATQHVEIPAGPMLIGLFHRPERTVALVRDAIGEVVHVVAGSRVNGAVVVAIGETSIFLEKDGVERVLSLAG